jgi:hypothetical protein
MRHEHQNYEMSVYEGSTCIGHIREQVGRRTATTWPDEQSLGVFPTRKAAADALSKAYQERHSYQEDHHD